jgi:hypothetical protein
MIDTLVSHRAQALVTLVLSFDAFYTSKVHQQQLRLYLPRQEIDRNVAVTFIL